jgi:hypothetical protein
MSQYIYIYNSIGVVNGDLTVQDGVATVSLICVCLNSCLRVNLTFNLYFQNWGDLYSLTLALLIYFFLMLMLCVFCRFGEELTNQVCICKNSSPSLIIILLKL